MKALQALLLFTLLIILNNVHAENVQQEFSINGHKFQIQALKSDFSFSTSDVRMENGIYYATIHQSLKNKRGKAMPTKFSVKWQTPSHDIAGVWNPIFNNDHIIPADWSSKALDSMLTRNAPVYTLFGHDDVNRYTVAVSDAVNLVHLSAKVREEDSMIYHELEFLSEKHKAVNTYSVKIRIDMRNIPFYQSLSDVASWWANMPEFKPTHVPNDATDPMYSTWYSYHQVIDHDELLAEAKIAASLGYKAIIVDDGWQTNDSNRGYAYTGDWEPERLKNIEKFVDEIHQLGMKALLWYSIPFVGEKAKVADTFKGKYLSHSESLETYVLDPRYPEVRKYLIDHYVNAIKHWKWDGLKLDFIDQFKTNKDTVLEKRDGRDFASVYEAVDKLMSDLIIELTAINPDVMVEFRQRYIGPAMRKYGNMFRATDIPNGAVTNRRRIVDLRLLSGDTAVHSDMLMWHYEEPVEIAALQLLNIFHSVPQLSVRLAELPKSHLNMVTHYTQYWSENKDVLLNGSFKPKGIFANYPLISSEKGQKQIIALYDDVVANISESNINQTDILNAKKSTSVIVKFENDWQKVQLVVKDCEGNVVSKTNKRLQSRLLDVEVPASGLLSIVKM